MLKHHSFHRPVGRICGYREHEDVNSETTFSSIRFVFASRRLSSIHGMWVALLLLENMNLTKPTSKVL